MVNEQGRWVMRIASGDCQCEDAFEDLELAYYITNVSPMVEALPEEVQDTIYGVFRKGLKAGVEFAKTAGRLGLEIE